MKKYIFSFALSLLLFLAVKIASNNTSPSIQMIVHTSPLEGPQVADNIEKELSRMRGISFYKFSLDSDMLLVNYDDQRINDSDILDVLKKWGCDTYDI